MISLQSLLHLTSCMITVIIVSQWQYRLKCSRPERTFLSHIHSTSIIIVIVHTISFQSDSLLKLDLCGPLQTCINYSSEISEVYLLYDGEDSSTLVSMLLCELEAASRPSRGSATWGRWSFELESDEQPMPPWQGRHYPTWNPLVQTVKCAAVSNLPSIYLSIYISIYLYIQSDMEKFRLCLEAKRWIHIWNRTKLQQPPNGTRRRILKEQTDISYLVGVMRP